MVSPSDITGFINNKWFSTLAGAGKWLAYILVSILVLTIFWFLLRYFEHKKKVVYFQIYGGDPAKLRVAAEDGKITKKEIDDLGIQLGFPNFARLKDIKERGVRKCSLIINSEKGTFLVPKVIKDIPYNLRYPEGIWMVRLSKDNFVPIERPGIANGIQLNISEPDMDLWEESARAEIKNRTMDDDASKRALTMTVAVIIGAFVLSGLIIWLSMSFAGKSINDVLVQVKPMTEALQTMAKGAAPG